MPFCCFKAFLEKFIEKFSFRHKMTIFKRALKYSESLLFYHVWKEKILRKIWICLNYCFWSNQLRGINFNKKCFSPQSEPHTLNFAVLLFWSIFVEIHRELFFLDIKVAISETSTEKLRKFVFLTIFERGKSWGKFGFV